jgi:hypothetical protein
MFAIPSVTLVKLPKIRSQDGLYFLLFLYFFTLHADQFNWVVSSFTFRVNNLCALALCLAFFMICRHSLFLFHKPLLWGIALFSTSLFVSFLFSPYKARCFFFMGWYGFTMLCYFFLPYLAMFVLNTKKFLFLYFLSFLLVGLVAPLQLVLSALGISFFAEQYIDSRLVRPNAFAYEPSFFALYMTPFMILLNLHFMLQKQRNFYLFKTVSWKKIIFVNGLFLASTATTTLFTYLIFFLFLFFLTIAPGWKDMRPLLKSAVKKILLFSIVLFGGLFFLFPNLSKKFYLKFFFQGFASHHSFFERWVGIINSWKIFLEHPLVGIGIGGIPPYLCEAWLRNDSTFIFLKQAELVNHYEQFIKLFEPSNVFTEVLASLGIFGLLALSFLMYGYIQTVVQAMKKFRHDEGKKIWIGLFFISVCVMLIVLQFNQGFFRTYIWAHCAIAYAFTVKQASLNQEIVSKSP